MLDTYGTDLTGLATWQVLAVVVSLSFFIFWLFKVAYGTDLPRIKGIPEIPHAVPFYGHLKFLGSDHPSAFQEFYREDNKCDVVQAKLGNRRILVVNSYEAAQDFFVKNASATIDRPLFYTFHNVVSKTQGGTVGTAPWNESTKRMRTAIGALMTRPAIQRSAPMLDIETAALVNDMFALASNGTSGVDPRIFCQRQALNLTLMWCYGTRIASVEDPLLHKILRVARSVSS
jgi:phenylacetate 2-hydroxylase